jgi:hypothetical protein
MTQAAAQVIRNAYAIISAASTTTAMESGCDVAGRYPNMQITGFFPHGNPCGGKDGVPTQNLVVQLQPEILPQEGPTGRIMFEAYGTHIHKNEIVQAGHEHMVLRLQTAFDAPIELRLNIDRKTQEHHTHEKKTGKATERISAAFDPEQSRNLTILMRYLFRHHSNSVKSYIAIGEIADHICTQNRNVVRTNVPYDTDDDDATPECGYYTKLTAGPIEVTLSVSHGKEGNQRIDILASPTLHMEHMHITWNEDLEHFTIETSDGMTHQIFITRSTTNRVTHRYDKQRTLPLKSSTGIGVAHSHHNSALIKRIILDTLQPYSYDTTDEYGGDSEDGRSTPPLISNQRDDTYETK